MLLPSRNFFAMPFAEFVALMALMMALTALSLDIMLPALPDIGASLDITEANHRQLVITFYLLGFAGGQFLFGPLSDRFGRKAPLYAGLALFVIATLAAIMAENFAVLCIARVMQGIGAAAPRIIAIAIIRDRFTGREMARVMSFVMMVFIIVPILAPSIGEGIMQISTWRSIFALLLFASLITFVWAALRLPETQPPENRLPLSAKNLSAAALAVLTTRQTLGYVVVMGFTFGVMMSYITSAEQIFVDVYKLGSAFPLVFGAISSALVLAAFINSQIVERYGMRRVSHLALLSFVIVCAIVAFAGFPERPPLLLFALFVATAFLCFGLMWPNFNALAMEPMGRIAGTASSFAGFYSTATAAGVGAIVGQSFDGSVRPMMIGFTVLGLLALATVLITERGQLARQHKHPPPRRRDNPDHTNTNTNIDAGASQA